MSFLDRIANLRNGGGLNGSILLNDLTVTHNDSSDMRWLLCLAMALTCAFAYCAQDVDLATAKARAAFALAKLKREASPADAKVKAAAGFKKYQENRDVDCSSDLNEAIKRADA